MNSKPQDLRSARPTPLLIRSIGCLGSASLLTSSVLLNGLALAQESLGEAAAEPGAGSTAELLVPSPPEPIQGLPAPELAAPVVKLAPQDLPSSGQTQVETVFDESLADYAPRLDIAPAAGAGGSFIDDSELYSTGATNSGDVYAGDRALLNSPAVVLGDGPAQGQQTDSPRVVIGSPSATPNAPLTAGASAAPGAKANGHHNGGGIAPTNITAAQAERLQRGGNLPRPAAAATTQLAGRRGSGSGYSVTYPTNNPLSMAVQHLGQTIAPSLNVASYYARTQRPRGVRGNGDRQLLFPLSIPAPISSVFGWRQHPIFGEQRFHSGTDLAAEQGTPIVATLTGKVSIADFLGGYGLTVVLDHTDGRHQTLYGHMSEIFVQPGQMVKQGEVIGRVGSTGNSTGPHLHFEVRELTNQGWVAIDPGRYLEGSIAQLMQLLREGPMQPIAKADAPFLLTQQQLGGLLGQSPQPTKLSTGLQPLLQRPQKAFEPSTPLEAKVVAVVKALEGNSPPRPVAPSITTGLTQQFSSTSPVSYRPVQPKPAQPTPSQPKIVTRAIAAPSERDQTQ